jgi:hypothetical protein
MKPHKNLNSDITTALSPYGIDNFLIMGLQDVPGSNEQRRIWSLSTKDPQAFSDGLIKLFLEHAELVRLLLGALCAGDIYQRLVEAAALIQKTPGKA